MKRQKDEGPVWALGAMSGTSLDGVDAAMLLTDGHRILEFGRTGYRAYTAEERAALRAGLGRWPGDDLDAAGQAVLAAHAALLGGFEGASVVGFHGQTLAHEPRGRGTHQIGDAEALARMLGLPVVWDFRSADVALGGEGAPLAPFYHFACARHVGANRPLAFLNLGGVGNLTWIDPRCARPDSPGALLAFDTGPANAPIDDLLNRKLGLDCDRDGAIAARGSVDGSALEACLADPYFLRVPPKSLDRGAFDAAARRLDGLDVADAAATLSAFAAATVALGVRACPEPPERVLVTGGGRHNRTLMAMLDAALDCPVSPVESVGLDGDMMEAQAFAFLAVRVLRGMTTSAPGTTGVATAIGGGQVAHP